MLTVSNLISDLRAIQSSNSRVISRLSHSIASLSAQFDGAGILYSQDVQEIKSNRHQSLNELEYAIAQLKIVNSEIDNYINFIIK